MMLQMAKADPVTRIKRAVRKAERETATGGEIGGTGFTVLRLRASPVARLADRQKISADELRAAQEISRVFMAISGALMIRPHSFEQIIRGHDSHTPAWLLDGWKNYKRFADHWSVMAKRGHPLLAIVTAAVVDEHSLDTIEADLRLRHGKAEQVLIAGLRDYAARAGWVRGHLARAWQLGASGLFRLR